MCESAPELVRLGDWSIAGEIMVDSKRELHISA
jgi:hypothetical protein